MCARLARPVLCNENCMHTRTTTKMMEDLRDPQNAGAWSSLNARYRPILFGFGKRLGFSADDAAEIAQDALVEFAIAYRAGKYERGKGRLSSWLIGIAHNLAFDLRRQRKAREKALHSALDNFEGEISDDARLTHVWEQEQQSAILAEAFSLLRQSSRTEESTLRAFELFALRNMPAEAVAAECGINVESVYVIKNRLTSRLREIVHELTIAYREDE